MLLLVDLMCQMFLMSFRYDQTLPSEMSAFLVLLLIHHNLVTFNFLKFLLSCSFGVSTVQYKFVHIIVQNSHNYAHLVYVVYPYKNVYYVIFLVINPTILDFLGGIISLDFVVVGGVCCLRC